jgi:O-antigen/teichoic acid export membrane protein
MVQITMDTFEFISITTCIIIAPKNLNLFLIVVLLTKLLNTGICNIAAFLEIKKEIAQYLKTPMNLINDRKKEIRSFIIEHSFGNTLKTLMNQGDVLLLNYFASPTAVGIYAISKKLGYAILAITDPLVTTIYPQISQLVSQKKFNDLKTMLIRISKLTTIPLTIISVIVFIFKANIIILFYGNEFANASNTFFIHFIGAAQSAIFFWALPLIQSMNLARARLFTYVFSMIIGITLASVLTPSLGASGIALSLLSTNIVITILFIYNANREINTNLIQPQAT